MVSALQNRGLVLFKMVSALQFADEPNPGGGRFVFSTVVGESPWHVSMVSIPAVVFQHRETVSPRPIDTDELWGICVFIEISRFDLLLGLAA